MTGSDPRLDLLHDLIVGAHGQPGLVGSVAELRTEQSHVRSDVRQLREDLGGVAGKLDELLLVLAKKGVAPAPPARVSWRSQLAGQTKNIALAVTLALSIIQGVWGWHSDTAPSRRREDVAAQGGR